MTSLIGAHYEIDVLENLSQPLLTSLWLFNPPFIAQENAIKKPTLVTQRYKKSFAARNDESFKFY